MQVEDEVECGCGCPAHLQADCSGPGHAFNKEACQCECRDQAARRRSEYIIMAHKNIYSNVTGAGTPPPGCGTPRRASAGAWSPPARRTAGRGCGTARPAAAASPRAGRRRPLWARCRGGTGPASSPPTCPATGPSWPSSPASPHPLSSSPSSAPP